MAAGRSILITTMVSDVGAGAVAYQLSWQGARWPALTNLLPCGLALPHNMLPLPVVRHSFQGTRGDVQPFVALGCALACRGWGVTVAAPDEYRQFVEEHGLRHAGVGRSLQREMYETAQGRALRTARPAHIMRATRDFFSVELFQSWCACGQGGRGGRGGT